jgi:hypothetical protein
VLEMAERLVRRAKPLGGEREQYVEFDLVRHPALGEGVLQQFAEGVESLVGPVLPE